MFPHPLKNFCWLSEEEVANFNIMDIDPLANDATGYFLEVDLEYPPELHLRHSQFVLAPEQFTILEEHLTENQKQAWSILNDGAPYKPSKKLTGTFLPRKQYVVHAACLKFYLAMGLKLTKIYRILSFKQSKFIKPFVDHCTRLRGEATNAFEEKGMKLASNANYGTQRGLGNFRL